MEQKENQLHLFSIVNMGPDLRCSNGDFYQFLLLWEGTFSKVM